MSAIKNIPLTIYGQSTSGIKIPIGSTVEWDLGCEDPDTRAPFPLTACAVIMAVCKLDLQDNPIRPAIISRQATITDSDNGLCYVPWDSGDTVPAGIPYQPGRYSVEIWIEDVDGNRMQELLCGFIELTAAGRLPNDVIVPLPSQLPLAQGPPGNPGLTSTDIKVAAYSAAFNDRVLVDPTAGDFAITIPLASTAVNGATDTIMIKNVSDSENSVSITLQDADTIDGLTTYFIAAREVVTLTAYGDGLWGVV